MDSKPKSAEVWAKVFTAGRAADVEAGGRRGWSVDDRALLVNPVRRRAASGAATTVAVAVVVGGPRDHLARLAQKKTLTAIAGELGRSMSTVSQEVARNSGPNGYYRRGQPAPQTAHEVFWAATIAMIA